MSQLHPLNLFDRQLSDSVKRFVEELNSTQYKTVDEIGSIYNQILSEITGKAGVPALELINILVRSGEPASSIKWNKYTELMSEDIQLLRNQLDLLRSLVVTTFNTITDDVNAAENRNNALKSRISSLLLYSGAEDANLITFGDFFFNDDSFDYDLMNPDAPLVIVSSGSLTLDTESLTEITNTAKINILDSSNGFPGNNQMVINPTNAEYNQLLESYNYTFAAELDPRNDVNTLLDTNPDTWFEYEAFKVSSANKAKAKSFNFTYKINGETINWAEGPDDDELNFDFQMEFDSAVIINSITYVGYFMEEYVGPPVRINAVNVSLDGVNWTSVSSGPIYIGSGKTIADNQNIYLDRYTWRFPKENVRYIKFEIEQPESVNVPMGHVYWEQNEQRVQGPVPNLEKIRDYYLATSVSNEDIDITPGKREVFWSPRWMIGIRDINIQSNIYKTTGTMITKPFRVPANIDRVAIESDIFIPSSYDANTQWVRFYVSPDDGKNWHQIARVQDDIFGLKEVLAFNDPLPEIFKEPGVDYKTTSEAVKSLRLRIDIDRSPLDTSSAPIVRWFKLKVITK